MTSLVLKDKDKKDIQEYLSCVYTDILMLKEGVWVPDSHTCDASIGMLENVANKLEINLFDTRE